MGKDLGKERRHNCLEGEKLKGIRVRESKPQRIDYSTWKWSELTQDLKLILKERFYTEIWRSQSKAE